jgi:hypothetical protein
MHVNRSNKHACNGARLVKEYYHTKISVRCMARTSSVPVYTRTRV